MLIPGAGQQKRRGSAPRLPTGLAQLPTPTPWPGPWLLRGFGSFQDCNRSGVYPLNPDRMILLSSTAVLFANCYR
jgi:hypothetical protein